MSQHIDPPMMQASVVDNLTTNDGTKALSAKQGKALNDGLSALNSKLSINGVGTSITFQCNGNITQRQYVAVAIGNGDMILVTIHSSDYNAVSMKTGTAKTCTISGNNITVSGLNNARYYLLIPDYRVINNIVFAS